MKKTKKLTFLALMTTLALVLSFVESLFPPVLAAAPGIKLGLPNVIIIFLLYRFSLKEAAVVSFLRLFAAALLFGNAMTFIYSLSGAVLSLATMVLLKKLKLFSTIGVSVGGGIFHNLGQIIAAVIILSTKEIGYYMAILAVTGTIAGVFVGLMGAVLLKYSEKLFIKLQ